MCGLAPAMSVARPAPATRPGHRDDGFAAAAASDRGCEAASVLGAAITAWRRALRRTGRLCCVRRSWWWSGPTAAAELLPRGGVAGVGDTDMSGAPARRSGPGPATTRRSTRPSMGAAGGAAGPAAAADQLVAGAGCVTPGMDAAAAGSGVELGPTPSSTGVDQPQVGGDLEGVDLAGTGLVSLRRRRP